MSNVIDFTVERAVRKSGLSRTLVKKMIADGFDPLDPSDVGEHADWFPVSANVNMKYEWTEEALEKLLADLKDLTDD